MPDLSHPDELTGILSRLARLISPRVQNTLDRVGAYQGLPSEALFPAPTGLPKLRVRRRWDFGGLVSEDLSFRSQHDPIEPEFRRHYWARRRRIHTVWARRIRPVGPRRRPRLLYLHGYMQPETLVEEFTLLATMARRLDTEVVQLQPPYHGRRKPRRSRLDGELYWTADVVRSLESLRQSLLDARTLLGCLHADRPGPVGVSGLSLGGALTAALTCLEPGFAFSMPFVAHMDLGRLVADAPVLENMRRDLARFRWSPQDFADFMTRIGWDDLRPVLPRERILLFAASDDRFFAPEAVTAMWKRWGEPPIEWYPCSHMGFIAHLPEAIGRMREFVDGLLAEDRLSR
jgi:pimeloyl-ACP methyl ester carboxylesterase